MKKKNWSEKTRKMPIWSFVETSRTILAEQNLKNVPLVDKTTTADNIIEVEADLAKHLFTMKK